MHYITCSFRYSNQLQTIRTHSSLFQCIETESGGGLRGWRVCNVQDWQTADPSSSLESCVTLGLGKKSNLVKVREIVFLFKFLYILCVKWLF